MQFSAVVFFFVGENIQMFPGDSQHWRLEVKWIDIGAHQVQLIWFVKCVSYIQRLPDNLDNFSRVKAVKRENTKDKYLYNFHKNSHPVLQPEVVNIEDLPVSESYLVITHYTLHITHYRPHK